jgi:hypothetical protein
MSLAQWLIRTCSVAVPAVLIAAAPAVAEELLHLAENRVPVAVVEVIRTQSYTEVRLETQAPRPKVCWSFSGPNSPYLLASEHRYRFLSGDAITDCPNQQDYAAHQYMVLRFEPLPPHVREFSLVEGEGGENQMIDPAAHRGTSYWNFLHVKLD